MDDFRTRIEKLSPKRLALLALELQSRIEELESQRSEPIAIIGMACRVPGADTGLDGFWRLLAEGRDAITEIPPERWDCEAYYDPDPDTPGRMSTKWGGFLADVAGFDAPFFGISRREAASMDPQQRMLLEMSWEAIEDAGQSPRRLSGSDTGVFMGLATSDYHSLLAERGEENIDTYFATGTCFSIAAGRISYALGLNGPNIAIDTACSSSLVAVHMACQSLRMRDCRLALAGGVNAILRPEVSIALSRAHTMASDGRCKTFDSRADGFVRGEGGGIVLLKRLSDAIGDRDNIRAVLRASAINQDGRSSGITAPSGGAQERVIRQALANGGLSPLEIDYVEAHGTGTALGDPIEAHALAAVLGGRTPETPLVVGSLKTNIGHLEAAAGVVGLIKTVLALQNQSIPPHLHFQQLNPHIDWGGAPVTIPSQAMAWPRGERPRRAGVSSFGFSGTNSHVIVEESPVAPAPQREGDRPLHLLALSGRTRSVVDRLAERYSQVLQDGGTELGDVCYTANAGRAHFDERAAYVGRTGANLLGGQVICGKKEGTPAPVFLFSGQGGQYAGMGQELYRTQPVFRRTLDECAELLRGELEKPLLDVMWGNVNGLLDQTAYTQPALFALEYAVTRLWQNWGIEPAVVLGHSVGEYVAACVAGVYGLAEGIKLIAVRGRLMQEVGGRGGMLAVLATEGEVRAALAGLEHRVSIAALNAPKSVVVAGYEPELGEVERRFEKSGVVVRRLQVSHGFHSPQMAPMEDAFERVAAGLTFHEPRVEVISGVTGRPVGREELGHASYWRRQVRQPVRFADALEQVRRYPLFLEVGPGTVLAGMGRQCLPGEDRLWLTSLRKGRSEWEQMLESLSHLYVRGTEVDWENFDAPYRRRKVALPTYPFEHQRYWADEGQAKRTPSVRGTAATGSSSISEPEVPADWFYTTSWRRKPVEPSSQPNGRAGSWLIVPDDGGFAEELANRLKQMDATVVVQTANRAIESYLEGGRFDHVVHLRSLTSPAADGIDAESLASSQAAIVASVLITAQALIAVKSRSRLWLVTCGAQMVDAIQGSVRLLQAPVWGMGRTIGLEHPEIWGGLIDLDPAETAPDGALRLPETILCGDGEDQVAFRGGERAVARLLRREPPQSSPPVFRPERLYLITGGLGRLGLKVAKWMVEHGARRLLLVGRRGLPDAAAWDGEPADGQDGQRIAAVRRLQQLGAEVRISATDICDRSQVEALFASFNPAELAGIVHLAGALEAAPVSAMSDEALRRVLAPKTAGTWLLHGMTESLPLDFFVLFSSWAAVVGAQNLAHYSAANQFLDAFAHYRRSKQLPALSVNWATWDAAGSFSDDALQEYARGGLHLMPSELALAALGKAMSGGDAQITIAAVDWAVLKTVYEARRTRPLLELVANTREEKMDRHSAGERFRNQLAKAAAADRLGLIIAAVREGAAAVLRLQPDELPLAQGLFELGMDSLMAAELKTKLEVLCDLSVPATTIFRHPTVCALAEYLERELRPETQPAAKGDDDSEDELAAMLATALQEIL